MNKLTLTVNELTEIIGLGKTTIYALVKSNEIPHIKVRGKILFNRELIELWSKGEYVKT